MDELDDDVADVDLVARVRSGDRDAAVDLWTRHYPAVLLAARRVTRQPRDAEEVASDAFSGMLAALSTGAGPTTSVRAYLVTSVRNLAASRARRPSSGDVITDDVAMFDRATPDTTAHMSELELVRVAFADLPRRWQIVLWRTAVDKDSNIEVGQAMGLSANGVAALARRARRGFRLAYLRAHLSDRGIDAECEPFVDGLADLTVSTVGAPTDLLDHVSTCARCTKRIEELRAVDRNLAGVIAPAVFGLFPSKLLLGGVGGGSGLAAAAQASTVSRRAVGSPARWAMGSVVVAGTALAILIASRPEAGVAPRASPPVTPSSRPSATASPDPSPEPSPEPSPAPPSSSPVPSPTPSTAPTPQAPAPSTTTPSRPPASPPVTAATPMGPMTVGMSVGGTPEDTAIEMAADVVGTVGSLRLTVQVPAGVTLTDATGDWQSCSQNGVTITCSGPHAEGGSWTGTIRTAWATAARGRVSATVDGTYANGSPAMGSLETTWPP